MADDGSGQAQDGWPAPGERIVEDAAGTPVVLADGKEWLLADGGLGNMLDEVRDNMFHDMATRQSVANNDVAWAAWVLLSTNYRLALDEGKRLIHGADMEVLTPAVCESLFGRPRDINSLGYTSWARATLDANGIDPAGLTATRRRDVLQYLVAIGRAIPADKYIASIESSRALEEFRRIAIEQEAERKPPAVPA
jgi:hypothetical protein